MLLHQGNLLLHSDLARFDQCGIVSLELCQLSGELSILFLLDLLSFAAYLELFFAVFLAFSLKCKIFRIDLLLKLSCAFLHISFQLCCALLHVSLKLTDTLLHVFLERISLSSVSLVSPFTFFTVKFPLLLKLICMSSVDTLNLFDIGLLALSVHFVQLVDGLAVLLLGLKSKHILGLKLLLESLDFTRQFFLITLVVRRLGRQSLLSSLKLFLELITSTL